MKEEWLQALGKMTYGIYVLTTFHRQEINGMIVSWVSQISYEPALIMVAIHPDRYSHRLIELSGYFALHVLAKEQTDFLARFKGPDPVEKFSSIEWLRGKTGCPVLKDCVAYLECRVEAKYTPGNHTLFLGEVLHGRAVSSGNPMSTLDYDRTYTGKT